MANITATAKKLKIAGRNGKRVDTLGQFLTLQEARDSVTDGSIVPDADSVNVKSIVDVLSDKWYKYEWSHSLSDFVQIGRGDGSSVLANAYIRLAGSDEHIEFEQMQAGNAADCILNLDKDFSLSITIPLIDTPENGQRIKMIENGTNAIQFNIGSSNYGVYFTDGSLSQGANVWVEIAANDELTFVYTASTNYMAYYINGVYKANLALANRTNNADGNVKIGMPTGANRLKGGVDNFIAWDYPLSANDLVEVASGVAIESRTAYPAAVAYCRMGEDVYPHVSDLKGNLQDGALINGSPADFVAIT